MNGTSLPDHVVCAGIGGIGMSAIAQWLKVRGALVTGTDRVPSVITDLLTRQGIPVAIPEPAVLPSDAGLLVFSDALPDSHPLRNDARQHGVPERSYQEMLGELTLSYSTVAIAGSHGKSTTTALAGLLLERAGQDPTVVVGTRVPQWSGNGIGNFRAGTSRLAVVEADEYREHFLFLRPEVAVVLSLDHDHVDAFPSRADYLRAYEQFVHRIAPAGVLVLPDEQDVAQLRSLRTDLIYRTFSADGETTNADVSVSGIKVREGAQEFSCVVRGESWGVFRLPVPGIHVVSNAAAALAVTLSFGVMAEVARESFAAFRGTWRRFELVGTLRGAPVISDYAHHPTELRALAAAARQWYPKRNLVIVFQPHHHARTRAFGKEFQQALALFDEVVLTDVYDVAGREEETRVSVQEWVEPLRKAGVSADYAGPLDAVQSWLQSHATAEGVLLLVGAGTIDTVARLVPDEPVSK